MVVSFVGFPDTQVNIKGTNGSFILPPDVTQARQKPLIFKKNLSGFFEVDGHFFTRKNHPPSCDNYVP
jgi:hypothetical protein